MGREKNNMNLIGKKIRIVSVVEAQGEDYEHQVFLRGTWGGITIYPAHDEFEILD